MATRLQMNIQDTLLAFGEWLDTQRICYHPEHTTYASDGEELTHDEVAKMFIEHWRSDPGRADLPGDTTDHIIENMYCENEWCAVEVYKTLNASFNCPGCGRMGRKKGEQDG